MILATVTTPATETADTTEAASTDQTGEEPTSTEVAQESTFQVYSDLINC